MAVVPLTQYPDRYGHFRGYRQQRSARRPLSLHRCSNGNEKVNEMREQFFEQYVYRRCKYPWRKRLAFLIRVKSDTYVISFNVLLDFRFNSIWRRGVVLSNGIRYAFENFSLTFNVVTPFLWEVLKQPKLKLNTVANHTHSENIYLIGCSIEHSYRTRQRASLTVFSSKSTRVPAYFSIASIRNSKSQYFFALFCFEAITRVSSPTALFCVVQLSNIHLNIKVLHAGVGRCESIRVEYHTEGCLIVAMVA